MPGDNIEKGDKVSWNWGGGAPGGTVADKKDEGELAITSHRGNTIKKNAEPDNPAVKVSRSGNDVVKRANELNVEQKGSGNSKKGDKKSDKKNEKPKEEAKKEDKDDDEEQEEDEEEEEEEEEGEEEGEEEDEAPPAKKAKANSSEPAAKRTRGRPKKEESQKKSAQKADGEKRPRGRPKSDPSKTKAPAKSTATGAAGAAGKRGRPKKAAEKEAPEKKGKAAKTNGTKASSSRKRARG